MRHALRERRRALGLTQAELAVAAAVSRPLVSAVEAGRHVPNVSAALALAHALGSSVEELFGREDLAPVPVVPGSFPGGAPVRVGCVENQPVYAPLPEGGAASLLFWAGDGWLSEDHVRLFPAVDRAGLVVAGCEPALGLLAELLPWRGPRRLIPVHATSGEAREALAAGRTHAAVVHGRSRELRREDRSLFRFELASWRVGLASASQLPITMEAIARGQIGVAQRDPSAATQLALMRALQRVSPNPDPRGPRAAGHLDAARRVALGAVEAALTIEPAACAYRLRFEPLEEHRVELWIPERFLSHPGAQALMDTLASARFRDRLGEFGGYHLAASGTQIES
jgi:DNA-binding XRE family transcriptional regulator